MRVMVDETLEPDPATLISPEELQLAARNHGMPLEALRYEVTPLGLHYLLTHYDIPVVDPSAWRLSVGGAVRQTLSLSLDDVTARPAVTLPVTMECAGNGRSRLVPRPISQPWVLEAVGTGEWTGTPLRAILEEAVPGPEAIEAVFTGLDRGVEGGIDQSYERSLSLGVALGDEVILAYRLNGEPLPPQHGFPLRLLVPGWYGMTSVKWLDRITLVTEPFDGYQQTHGYRYRSSEDEEGTPVTRMSVRSLMVPPGIPEFMSRERFVDRGRCRIEGRAWSGWAAIERVDMSTDGGVSWEAAGLGTPPSPFAWTPWSFDWEAEKPGRYELCSRATDAGGNVQPLLPAWNVGGYSNNAVQRVDVTVRG
jgi:sulfane dehydrogenase subunit SoxC